MVFMLFLLLDMLVAKWEPTPCYRDAYSVGIPKGACGEKSGQIHCKTTVSPLSPLALPSFVTSELREFFKLGRVLRTTLPTGKGGVVHLFVVSWASGCGGRC